MTKPKWLLPMLAVLIVCGNRPASADEPAPAGPPAQLVEGNNRFALDLYQQLAKKSDGAIFFSPYSVSTALAMAYAGAKGDTAEQMAKTLHFTLPSDKLNAAFGDMLRKLTADDPERGFQLHVANRLWAQQGYKFLPAFLQVTKDSYGAELGLVDFVNQTEVARTTINDWVAKQTNDKIQDLVPQGALTDQTRLVLTNAIYFNARWQSPFHEASTAKGSFHVSAQQTAQIDFMRQKSWFGYSHPDKLQLLEMPYEGSALVMDVLLPNRVDGLADLEKSLTSAALDGWLAKLDHPEANVTFPKFKLTEQADLGAALSTLGMPLAFSANSADFSGMNGNHDLFLSAVLHKAYVDVNENGTEAAAATAGVFGATAVPAAPPENFKADHPFVILIRDSASGSIYFMGRYLGPK